MSDNGEVIERIEAPSREYFEKNYMDKNKPVILTGVSTKWPAMSQWTPEYFKKKAGDAEVTVHYNEKGSFFEWYINPQGRIDQKMKLADLLDILLAEPADPRYYMTEHELRLVSRELLKDVDFSDYLVDVAPFEPLLFLGRDTCMPLHYHGTTEAFLCQLRGEKRITLFSPEQHAYLYAKPWYQPSPLFSRIDGRSIQAGKADLQKFPRYKKARPMEFMLHPGEILFIPVHWWHLTSVNGFQVSVTHFWKASLGAWRFPTPGLQVIARELLFQARNKINQAKMALLGKKAATA